MPTDRRFVSRELFEATRRAEAAPELAGDSERLERLRAWLCELGYSLDAIHEVEDLGHAEGWRETYHQRVQALRGELTELRRGQRVRLDR